jgi:hypothetical protein
MKTPQRRDVIDVAQQMSDLMTGKIDPRYRRVVQKPMASDGEGTGKGRVRGMAHRRLRFALRLLQILETIMNGSDDLRNEGQGEMTMTNPLWCPRQAKKNGPVAFSVCSADRRRAYQRRRASLRDPSTRRVKTTNVSVEGGKTATEVRHMGRMTTLVPWLLQALVVQSEALRLMAGMTTLTKTSLF